MDNSLSESARFAVYREKLKGICEANNLSYVFIKNAYPIKLRLISMYFIVLPSCLSGLTLIK